MKRFGCLLMSAVLALSMLTACVPTVDEPCAYCNNRPSKEYEKRDGSLFYVCEECSSKCMLCGDEKAEKHYESLLGIVFVCDDCYEAAYKAAGGK